MASFWFGRKKSELTPEDAERINAVLQRDMDALTSFFILKEIICLKAELMIHLLRPGIVERVLDFLRIDDLVNDPQSTDALDILVKNIIYASPKSPWLNISLSVVERFVALLTNDSTYVCEVVIKLLAKLTQNENVQLHVATAGAIDVLVLLLSFEGLSSACGSILQVLTNVAQNRANAIWFRMCMNELMEKMPSMLHDGKQSVRYRAAKLMVSICTHNNMIAPEVAFHIIDLLLTAAVRNAHDPMVHEVLTSALSSLHDVPDYRPMIDRNTLVLGV